MWCWRDIPRLPNRKQPRGSRAKHRKNWRNFKSANHSTINLPIQFYFIKQQFHQSTILKFAQLLLRAPYWPLAIHQQVVGHAQGRVGIGALPWSRKMVSCAAPGAIQFKCNDASFQRPDNGFELTMDFQKQNRRLLQKFQTIQDHSNWSIWSDSSGVPSLILPCEPWGNHGEPWIPEEFLNVLTVQHIPLIATELYPPISKCQQISPSNAKVSPSKC